MATAAGQRVVNGAVVNLVCNTSNPTPYAEWPDPAAGDSILRLGGGGGARGVLGFGPAAAATEKLIDDASVTPTTLMNAASEDSRLLYLTNPLTSDVRISGTPKVSLNVAFNRDEGEPERAARLAARDRHRHDHHARLDATRRTATSDYVTEPLVPGTFYKLDIDMQPRDVVVPAGRRLGLMVLASDRDYTVRPPARHRAHARSRQLLLHAPDRRRLEAARDAARRRPGGRHRRRHRPGHAGADARRSGVVRRVHAGRGEGVHGVHHGDRGLHRG